MTKEFFSAARRGDLESFIKELGSTSITAIDENGHNALQIAAGGGHLNVVMYILENFPQADIINDRDADGNAAVNLAETQEVLQVLVEHGALVNPNNMGQVPQFEKKNLTEGVSNLGGEHFFKGSIFLPGFDGHPPDSSF